MSEDRKKHLIIMVELCNSIMEGTEHLIKNQENQQLHKDIVSGFQSLFTSLESFQADPMLVRATKWLGEIFESGLTVYDNAFYDKLYRWYCMALKELRDLISDEFESCPVCGGKGSPCYSAIIYDDSQAEDHSGLEAVRMWMKCDDCENYFLFRDKAVLPVNKRSAGQGRKAPEFLVEFIHGENLLLIGDDTSPLYRNLLKSGYQTELCSLERFTEAAGKELPVRRFEAVFIERISDTADIKKVLVAAGEYLTDEGILWFDMPDIERAIQNLETRGRALWNQPIPSIAVTEQGMGKIAGDCGLIIKSCKHRRKAEASIEFTAGKDVITKKNNLH